VSTFVAVAVTVAVTAHVSFSASTPTAGTALELVHFTYFGESRPPVWRQIEISISHYRILSIVT
jgi:hypothetical protein